MEFGGNHKYEKFSQTYLEQILKDKKEDHKLNYENNRDAIERIFGDLISSMRHFKSKDESYIVCSDTFWFVRDIYNSKYPIIRFISTSMYNIGVVLICFVFIQKVIFVFSYIFS